MSRQSFVGHWIAAFVVVCASAVVRSDAGAQTPSAAARDAAAHAADAYTEDAIRTLAGLVSFPTVHEEGIANADHPAFRGMTAYLKETADRLGFDFADHGAVVVIGLGTSERRLGLVTHGDVQPADAAKWARSPFELDTTSEPGHLIGRGAEDDKGPIATALYAMKALADQGMPLDRRVELIVSYTEESDWNPFTAFLQQHPPPDLNVALDSEYPVVTAEKAWNAVMIRVPAPTASLQGPSIERFIGGAFLSQVPEDATAVIVGSTEAVRSAVRAAAADDSAVAYAFEHQGDSLRITARGRSAHSASPWDGVNAITHLAQVLGAVEWVPSASANAVRLINDLVGTGDYAERFGNVAYTHNFMGPLTLALTTQRMLDDSGVEIGVNIRSPIGRSGPDLDARIHAALDHWQQETGVAVEYRTTVTPPYYAGDAEHVPVLLGIYRHFTGHVDAQPIAIGGGTHARTVPNGVNFGPAMPDTPYTGHSEHEFMTRDQLMLNLRMYAAMLVELAATPEG